MNLDEAGRRAGAHAWFERRCFEVLGGWVTSVAEPGVKVMIDRHSAHSAWRHQQWLQRLPVMAGADHDALARAPDHGAERLLDRLAGTEGTVDRLAGAYRVLLPRMAAAYRTHLGAASVLADASARRTLNMALDDLVSDWVEGESRLQTLLVDGAAVDDAAACVSRLEILLVGRAR